MGGSEAFPVLELLKKIQVLLREGRFADQIVKPAQLEMGFGIVRIKRNSSFEHCTSFGFVTCLQVDRSQITKSRRVFWRNLYGLLQISDRLSAITLGLVGQANLVPGLNITRIHLQTM